MIFAISNTDFAGHVLAGNYKVNSYDITEAFTDASGIAHRRLKRKKISGSADMFFRTMAEFDAFRLAIDTYKTDYGSIPMTVTVNNLSADRTIDAFIDYEPVRNKDGMNRDYILQFTVKIEER